MPILGACDDCRGRAWGWGAAEEAKNGQRLVGRCVVNLQQLKQTGVEGTGRDAPSQQSCPSASREAPPHANC